MMQLVNSPDQLLPHFVTQIFFGGWQSKFLGLFVAGVLCASLSTVSSGLSALAAITFHDFIQGGCHINMAEKKKALLCKAISVIYGLLCYVLVYVIKFIPGIIQARDLSKILPLVYNFLLLPNCIYIYIYIYTNTHLYFCRQPCQSLE